MKCLDKNDELTSLGKILARLLIEPRLGKMRILECMFRVGNALSTMAANSTTLPEVYNMGPDMRRLTAQQKWFAGARFNDHVAMFHAFQAWEETRNNGEWAEQAFCDSKSLSLSTLRITWEAKVGKIAMSRCHISYTRNNDFHYSICAESTASVIAKCLFSRGDSVSHPVKLSSGRRSASRHYYRTVVHGPVSQCMLSQGEAEGSHHGIEDCSDSQDICELQQFRAELSVSVLRVRWNGKSYLWTFVSFSRIPITLSILGLFFIAELVYTLCI